MKSFRLKGKLWKIKLDPTMIEAKFNCGPGEYDGLCVLDSRRMLLNPSLTERES